MLRIEWTTSGGVINAVVFDCETRTQHEQTAEITEHAVERGANIADHIRPNNGTVNIEAEVTNTPLDAPETQADGVSAAFQARQITVDGQQVSVTTLGFSQTFDRRRAVDAVMQQLISSGTLVRIATALREYEDMALERFSTESTAATAHSLPVVIAARRVRLVDTQLVQVPEPVERRGRVRTERGGQAAQPTQRQSVLARGLDAIGVLRR